MDYLRSFRIVAPPTQVKWVEEFLHAEGFSFVEEPFSHYCRKLVKEPIPLGASLAAYFGYIYIQDRSSMLPPLALNPPAGAMVLDMAASPGSKTGFLAQLVGQTGFVLANEPSSARLATLRANLQRANLLQAATCAMNGANLPLFSSTWPYILLDPPCSGWGTAQKHPQTLKLWQGNKLDSLIRLQRQLLTKAAALLKPGGFLLYSTCTTNPAENDAQTAFAIRELNLRPVPLPQFSGFVTTECPHMGRLVDGTASQAQGFYLSLLTKDQGRPESGPQFKLASLINPQQLESPVFSPALLPPGKIGLFQNTVRFLPDAAFQLPQRFSWQAFPLGAWHNTFKPSARLRVLLPPLSTSRVVFEDLEPIRRLLSGQSLSTSLHGTYAGLWWKELPLGIAQIKNGRLLATFR